MAAILSAFNWPVLTVLFGLIVDVFVNYENTLLNKDLSNSTSIAKNVTTEEFNHEIWVLSGTLFFGWIAITIANYAMMTLFPLSALNQIHTIKRKYFDSILKQEISWFDSKSSGDFASRVSS